MASVPTDVLTRLYNALERREPATVKAILEPLDNEERKALLTSNTSQIEERSSYDDPCIILSKIQDPETLRVVLEGISACDRLDLLLTNVNSSSSYIDYRPFVGVIVSYGGLGLGCFQIICKSLTDKDWLTLLHTRLYDITLMGTLIVGDDFNFQFAGWEVRFVVDLLKFIFESVSPAELLNLLQLQQDSHGKQVPMITSLLHNRYSRDAVQVLLQYLGKSEQLCLFQTPYRDDYHDFDFGVPPSVYDKSQALSVQREWTREVVTTVIHRIFKIPERCLYDRAWDETMLHLVLNSLDNDDVVTLLSTQDGDGNTPLHRCDDFSTICHVLEQIEDNILRFQLLTRKNDNGDTPLHVINGLLSGYLSWLTILPKDMMSLLCLQNNQGNTILHIRLLDLESSCLIKAIKEVRLQSLNNPRHVFVKNCVGRTFLQTYLEAYQRAPSDSRVFSGTPKIVPLLEAIGLPAAVDVLCMKNEDGDAPVHQLCSLYPRLMPEISDYVGVTTELLTVTDRHGNTALHILAHNNPVQLCIVLKKSPTTKLGSFFQMKNSDGNTPLHLLSTESAYLHTIPQVLNKVTGSDRVNASELMKVKNKLGATPLHTALINGGSHNRIAFNNIVDVLGPIESLKILGVSITESEYKSLCSYHSSENRAEILNNLDRCSRYYILYIMGDEACTDLRQFVQALNDAEVNIIKEEIATLSNHRTPDHILLIEKLSYENGNSFFHVLADSGTESDHASLRKLLEAMTVDQRHRVLSCQNYGRQIPLHCAKSYKIRRLLEWSNAQEGFYYLQSPPVVLMMYSTADRTDADEESRALEAAFPQFDVEVRRLENPKRQEIMDAIMNEGQRSERISAMIVIIMSHGEQGSVCAEDGDVRIQDILLQMQAAVPQGQPKVLLVQACQRRAANQQSCAIAENVQSDPGPPSSQPRRTTQAELLAPSTSSQPLNTTHHYSRQSQSRDFSLQWRDFITMIATVPGGVAYRNQMIPMFAEELKDSKNNGDIYEIFIKTHHRLQKLIPDQVPEFRSTLTQKLSLRNIFRL